MNENTPLTRKQLKELGFRVFRKNGCIAIQYRDYGIEYGSRTTTEAWQRCRDQQVRLTAAERG